MHDDTLRARALEALGPHADPRAAPLLERASLRVDENVHRWTGSSGDVRAHRVRLEVDARSLGVVRAAPFVEDALRAAFAKVLSDARGESLSELVIGWNGMLEARVESYRGAAPIDGRAHLSMALAEYLDGAGSHDVARFVEALDVQESARHELTLDASPDVFTATAVSDAARRLLGEGVVVRWR